MNSGLRIASLYAQVFDISQDIYGYMALRYSRGRYQVAYTSTFHSSTLVKVDQHDRRRPVPPSSILDHTSVPSWARTPLQSTRLRILRMPFHSPLAYLSKSFEPLLGCCKTGKSSAGGAENLSGKLRGHQCTKVIVTSHVLKSQGALEQKWNKRGPSGRLIFSFNALHCMIPRRTSVLF